MWFTDQQHQMHLLGVYQKSRFSGPSPGLLQLNWHFNKIRSWGDSYIHPSQEELLCFQEMIYE